jgi:HAD superfamily hydrolase (TIGR01509 family)
VSLLTKPRPPFPLVSLHPGVILESEGLHRLAYNATFAHFDLRFPGQESKGPVEWSEPFYDDLQNKVGGGKPKMHHVFGNNASGYPSFSLPGEKQRRPSPNAKDDKDFLVDTLQAWKSKKYEAMIAGGEVPPRPGVLRLMDSAKESGLKVGVCSAATKSSVVAVLDALLGPARVGGLDVFLAGDDVKSKKPNPEIYETAAKRLGIPPESCCVVEDSSIGVAAAVGAGMRCVVTYTPSTASQAFGDAERIVADATALDVEELKEGGIVQDDRVEFKA